MESFRLRRAVVSAAGAALLLSIGALPGGVAHAASPAIACPGGSPLLLPDGRWACTSEPDAPNPVEIPEALDRMVLVPAGPSAVTCVDDGRSGDRVQALYVVAEDQTDRSETIVPLIEQWATQIDDIFATSSTTAPLAVRWVHDDRCVVIVDTVVIPADADDTFSATIQAVSDAGYGAENRRYLMWVDANRYCGIAVNFPDDRADQDNPNNGPWPLWGRVDAPCWGNAGMVETHELTHTLGAVQASAPHATPYGHCTDEYDIMCYVDGQGVSTEVVCPDRNGDHILDCGNDDYFDVAPAEGSYLASHWNVARSSFLVPVGGYPTPLVDSEYGDVRRDNPFAADIAWLADQGITKGCNPPANDRFCPDEAVTRGQMAAFLVRALHSKGEKPFVFTDVAGSPFAGDIALLAGAGITRGCSEDRFCPDQVVTRGQMAAFLVRALDLAPGASRGFSDTHGSPFEAEIDALAAAGVTSGCTQDRFCPDDPVTRGQMAALLRRAIGRPASR